MILMCCLGFFFGGPLKSYASYRTIKAMVELEKVYEKLIKTKESDMAIPSVKASKNLCDNIKNYKLHIGTSLVTINLILTNIASFIMFIAVFFLIEKYIAYVMAFFTLLGILVFSCDLIQNIIVLK